jgi:hypothetical protein
VHSAKGLLDHDPYTLDVDNSYIPSLPGADHKMADLFKLTLTPGNPLHERNAHRNLREEELYELVDRV